MSPGPASSEDALQRALSIRLNLQLALASLPVLEEWMDLHVDRWLEHVPAPPEMPPRAEVSYAVVLGSDLRHVTWSSWGDPAGFIPKLANYFQLCQMSKHDMAVLDQLGNALAPSQVGHWLTVTPGRLTTGWQFCEPMAWEALQEHFAAHAGKLAVHQWFERSGSTHVDRFVQTIGEASASALEFSVTGDDPGVRLAQLNHAVQHFGGNPLPSWLLAAWEAMPSAALGARVQIAGGQIVEIAALGPGPGVQGLDAWPPTSITGIAVDPALDRVVGSLAREGAPRASYVQRDGAVSLRLELVPGDPADNPARTGGVRIKAPAGMAN